MKTEKETSTGSTAISIAFASAKPFPAKKSALLSVKGGDGLNFPTIVKPKPGAADEFREHRQKVRQFAGDAIDALPELRNYVAELTAIEGWQEDPKIEAEVRSANLQIVEIEKVPAVRDQLLYKMVELAKTGDEFLAALHFGQTVSARAEEYQAGREHKYPRLREISGEDMKQFNESARVEGGRRDNKKFFQYATTFRGAVFLYFEPDGGFGNDTPFQSKLKKLIQDRRGQFVQAELGTLQEKDAGEKAKIVEIMKDPRFKPISVLKDNIAPGLYWAHASERNLEGRSRPEGLSVIEVYENPSNNRGILYFKVKDAYGSDRDFTELIGKWSAPIERTLHGVVPERVLDKLDGEMGEKVKRFTNMLYKRFFHAARIPLPDSR
ncbi:MAG: hypothetical protein AAB507_01060 [Patescibacteria group bacterium]